MSQNAAPTRDTTIGPKQVQYVIQKTDVRCYKPEENLLMRLRSICRKKTHRYVLLDLEDFSLLPIPLAVDENWERLDPNGTMGVT